MKRVIAAILLAAMLLTAPAVAATSKGKAAVYVAMCQLGAPYALKSKAPDSFNCLSFVAYCCNKVKSGRITAKGFAADSRKIASIRDLKPGDVIAFTGNDLPKSVKKVKSLLSYHYGLYAGKGYFIHAANKKQGVIISRLSDYKKRFVGAVRVF